MQAADPANNESEAGRGVHIFVERKTAINKQSVTRYFTIVYSYGVFRIFMVISCMKWLFTSLFALGLIVFLSCNRTIVNKPLQIQYNPGGDTTILNSNLA